MEYIIEINSYSRDDLQGSITLPTSSREKAVKCFNFMEQALKGTGIQLYLIKYDKGKSEDIKMNRYC